MDKESFIRYCELVGAAKNGIGYYNGHINNVDAPALYLYDFKGASIWDKHQLVWKEKESEPVYLWPSSKDESIRSRGFKALFDFEEAVGISFSNDMDFLLLQ